MEADENIDLSEEYCPLFLQRGMSIGDCKFGNPKEYKDCPIYNDIQDDRNKWKNTIPEDGLDEYTLGDR